MKLLLLLFFLPMVAMGQPTFGPYPIPGSGGGGPTNGQTAAQVATLINDTNVNRIQPVVDGKLAITNSYLKTNGNGSAVTALNGGNITAASIPITAADSSWASRTNFYNVTNATAGGAVVLVGPDASSNWYLKGTNWPAGGSGSQTPITSDIDYALFAMTNWSRIFTTNITGQFVITSNQTLLSSNAITTTYLRFSTNQYIHMGSNLVDTITLKSIDGSITASNFTATGTAASSNFFGGITYVASNAAPFSTISPSGLNSVTMNQRWTNDFNRQADLVLSVSVTDAATGVPILAFTNTITGECYTNSPNFGITGTPVYNIIYIGISPNDYGSFSNYSTGTGTAITINKAYWKLH